MILRENIKEPITTGKDIVNICLSLLQAESEIDRDKEHFWVFGLDAKNKIKYVDLCSLGTMTSSLVHPREVYRLAVLKGCIAILVAHNHPSGDPSPSRDDIAITEKLAGAGNILSIRLIDHVIVGNNSFISMLEKGYLTELI